ncbi:MAG TPA: protein kinase [Anaeromyxobacteraceae bacterium]|nr:protein kinase [Anaeromyxobacteraceae bacterium]
MSAARRARAGLPAPGTRIGPYEVLEGGPRGGAAWRVRARRGARTYALQVLDPAGRAPGGLRERRRIAEEVDALRALRHPNIVRVHALETWPEGEEGGSFLVTDLVDGEDLGEWCAGERTGKRCTALARASWAVEHLHRHGLVHRDLRLDAFLVATGGEPVLARFAVAGPARPAVPALAPELRRFLASAGERRGRRFEWRPATDLHALGRMILEALSGGPSAPGRPGEARRRPRATLAALDPAVRDLVRRLLERDPRRRPSAREVALALARSGRPEPEARAPGSAPAPPEDPTQTLPAHPPRAAEAERPAFDAPTLAVAPPFDPGPAPPAEPPPSAPEETEGTAASAPDAGGLAGSPKRRRWGPRAAIAVVAVAVAGAWAAGGTKGAGGDGRLAAGLGGPPAVAPDVPEPPPAPRAPRRRPDRLSDEAGAVDRELEREFGHPTVMPDGGIEGAPPAADPRLAPPAAAGDQAWLLRSRRPDAAPPPPAAPPRPRGVPMGLHLRARLLTGLDSRTVGQGPVEAVLSRAAVVRGGVALPAGTLAFGTAAESGGRFRVRFARLRLPDDTEVAFDGVAIAREDGKPGLPGTGRIEPEGARGGEAMARAARSAAGSVLEGLAPAPFQGLARGAADAVLDRDPGSVALPARALLLDAGFSFDIFVERSF